MNLEERIAECEMVLELHNKTIRNMQESMVTLIERIEKLEQKWRMS